MRIFRQFFGWLFLCLCLFFIGYGIKILESTEQKTVESKQLKEEMVQNPDVYAWLTVEGTNIDYPIVQHPFDDAYYLAHDVNHRRTSYGAIFTEKVNAKDFQDLVTIVYGHAIRDGAMFGSLDNFSDAETFETHQRIMVSTKDMVYTYQIVAAYPFNDEHLYHTFQLGDKNHVLAYMAQLETKAIENGGFYRQIDFDINKDKLLILSTCNDVDDSQRFIVHAIRRE